MHPHLHNVVAFEHMSDLARTAAERRDHPRREKKAEPATLRRETRRHLGLRLARPAV